MDVFRTTVDVNEFSVKVDINNQILLLGSCFAENMGQKLLDYKFQVESNPFGILYNPVSIAQSISRLINKKEFTVDDIIEKDGIFHSFYHHSRFSSTDRTEVLNSINQSLALAGQKIASSDFLFITFGTAWVFEYNKTGKVVSNCHKIPSKEFTRKRLSVIEVVSVYEKILNQLLELNPKLNIVFTVSPIRHMKDGAVENQLSKSTLLLAVSHLVDTFSQVNYFPAYEIVMDDLRDYRFYKNDMIHPSELAIDYIWNKFKSSLIKNSTFSLMDKVDRIVKAAQHKPFQPEAAPHQKFIKKQLAEIESLTKKYPQMDFSKEVALFGDSIIE